MIVDPVSGVIQECDVIFVARANQSGNQTAWPSAPPPPNAALATPECTTAFHHEMGHFFGLDHTNLHPGIQWTGPGTPSPSTVNFLPAVYPVSLLAQLVAPGLALIPNFSDFDLPAMSSFHTAFPTIGGSYVNHVYTPALQLHSDDMAGLSQIYPVASVASSPGKVPLGNLTATITGHVILSQDIDDGSATVFGTTLLVRPHAPGSAAVDPGPAWNGKLSGTRRAAGASIVGRQKTTTTPPTPTSGQFRIEGVGIDATQRGDNLPLLSLLPATMTQPPVPSPGGWPYSSQIDLIAEHPQSLLLSQLPAGYQTPAWAEWFHDPILNPTLNTFNSVVAQRAIVSDEVGVGWPPGTFRVPTQAVVQGTVIELLSPVITDGSPSTVEPVSRPLVEIWDPGAQPRTSIPLGGWTSGQLQVFVHSNTRPMTVRCLVNGASVPLSPPTQLATPAFGAPSVSMSYQVLNPTPIVAGSVVRAEAIEGQAAMPPGIRAVSGINEVRY